jgi:cytochrome c-type biogenesis protein CcsB
MNLAFNIALAGYLAALLLALAELFTRSREKLAPVTVTALALGAVAQTAWLGMRWVAAGRAPFASMFETLVLFAWALAVTYLTLQWRKRLPVLAGVTAALALAVLVLATTFDSSLQPLSPALRSRWLAGHVIACFLAYGAVAIAAVSGAAYLVTSRKAKCGNCDSCRCAQRGDALDAITDKAITFGFLLLTVGIVAGAVWANSAWGSYWSWDPKETWAFITWLIYAVYLHARHMRGWRGKRAAWIAVIGFASVIFTYLGVSFLMGGKHSYAGAERQRGLTILAHEEVPHINELAGPDLRQNGSARWPCRVMKQTS